MLFWRRKEISWEGCYKLKVHRSKLSIVASHWLSYCCGTRNSSLPPIFLLPFPKWGEPDSVFYYVSKVTIEPHGRMGAGSWENQHCDSRTGTFSPTPLTWEVRGAGGWFIHQWSMINQSCLCNETFIKTPKDEVWRILRLGNLHVTLCWAPNSTRTEAPWFWEIPSVSSIHWFIFFTILCNKWII